MFWFDGQLFSVKIQTIFRLLDEQNNRNSHVMLFSTKTKNTANCKFTTNCPESFYFVLFLSQKA